MLMVMRHSRPDGKQETRCPYCYSLRISVIDYDIALPHEQRFGCFRFVFKCARCKGESLDLTNLHRKKK